MNINLSHISLFPINLSILPFEEINIHIFENRYKQLISNCCNVVLISSHFLRDKQYIIPDWSLYIVFN